MPGHFLHRRSFSKLLISTAILVLLAPITPLFATRGMFQGRVVEGNKREAGKYIYVEARAGSMRRVNIQSCRVHFDASIPASQRVRSAAESLREGAQIRVTADQKDNGEWVAADITILKLPEIDHVRLLI
jgi:hypothetical protein